MAKYEEDFIDKLQEVFESTDISLNKLSKEYGVGKATIIKWSKDYGWSKKKTDQSKDNSTDQPTKKKRKEKKQKREEWERLGLTEKEMLFCLYYVKDYNGTQAVRKAGYNAERPDVVAAQIKKRPKVKEYISHLIKETTDEIKIDTKRILSMYQKMAFYDINDYIEFGSEEVEYEDKNGKKRVIFNNFLGLKNDVDGQLITEVSLGKDGVKIKMPDRQKALEKLLEYIDIPNKLNREKLELEKTKNGSNEENIEITFKEDLEE